MLSSVFLVQYDVWLFWTESGQVRACQASGCQLADGVFSALSASCKCLVGGSHHSYMYMSASTAIVEHRQTMDAWCKMQYLDKLCGRWV